MYFKMQIYTIIPNYTEMPQKNNAQKSIFPPNEKNVFHTYPSITVSNRQQHPCGTSSYSINLQYFVLYFFLF